MCDLLRMNDSVLTLEVIKFLFLFHCCSYMNIYSDIKDIVCALKKQGYSHERRFFANKEANCGKLR
jgi:hypothetical protein